MRRWLEFAALVIAIALVAGACVPGAHQNAAQTSSVVKDVRSPGVRARVRKWVVPPEEPVVAVINGQKVRGSGPLTLSTTADGKVMVNEKKRTAFKLVAGIAAAFGLGSVAGGAVASSVYRSLSSSPQNVPGGTTGIGPQGLYLPAVNADPASPTPGQMWYRADGGQTRYYDGVAQVDRSLATGKMPFFEVSAIGVANGGSTVPNDGADYGVDTPGTTTNGLLEALNALPVGVDGKRKGILYITDGTFNLQGLSADFGDVIVVGKGPDTILQGTAGQLTITGDGYWCNMTVQGL